MKLTKGDWAPEFELPDQKNEVVKLSHYRGRKILLFFYPKAGTSG